MKHLLTILWICCCYNVQAQMVFDSQRLNKIADIFEQSVEIPCDAENIYLYNIFDNQKVILGHISRKEDVYRVGCIPPVSGSAAYNHILLINRDRMTFINMKKPYEDVIKAVLKFFDRNKNVDKRLTPLYIQRITQLYLYNHRKDELGVWYDWFNEKDSISMKYYKFQYPQ